MSRLRALLAVLLAATWCSAAWHVDLEAVGLMFEHRHHAHDGEHSQGHAHHHGDEHSGAQHDDHEQVLARDVAKDQLRLDVTGALALAVLGLCLWMAAASRPPVEALKRRLRRPETGPPLARVWQFAWRCAPDSAAPPALV